MNVEYRMSKCRNNKIAHHSAGSIRCTFSVGITTRPDSVFRGISSSPISQSYTTSFPSLFVIRYSIFVIRCFKQLLNRFKKRRISKCRNNKIAHHSAKSIRCTFSVGITTHPPSALRYITSSLISISMPRYIVSAVHTTTSLPVKSLIGPSV